MFIFEEYGAFNIRMHFSGSSPDRFISTMCHKITDFSLSQEPLRDVTD